MNVKKYLLLSIIISGFFQAKAQDIFEHGFYAPDLIIKYKKEINVTSDQLEKIQSLYKDVSESFKTKKLLLAVAINELQATISKESISNEEAILELQKINAIELEIKKLKLSALIEVKNTLSPFQKSMLNKYKKENQALMKVFDMSISERDSEVTLKIRGNRKGKDKVIYLLKESNELITLKELADVDVDNIKSVHVFKGAAAVNLYGERARNGAVVIELKQNTEH